MGGDCLKEKETKKLTVMYGGERGKAAGRREVPAGTSGTHSEGQSRELRGRSADGIER